MIPNASSFVWGAMLALPLTVAAIGVGLYARAGAALGEDASARRRRLFIAALVAAAWLKLTAAVAAYGVLARFDSRPPPLLGLALWRGRVPRGLVAAWNVLGLALLATIMTIGMASTPLVHAFGTDPDRLNTWVAHFPYVWLPAVLVVSALAGHIVVFRRLALTPSEATSSS